jgi:hypothetical protein
MIIGNLKIFKALKTHHYQQHDLNLTKIVAFKEEWKQNPMMSSAMFTTRSVRSCGTFASKKKKPMSFTIPMGQFAQERKRKFYLFLK